MTQTRQIFIPGDVLALLTAVQDLQPGFYMLQSLDLGWATLRPLIDDMDQEKLIITGRVDRLPVDLLELFMPVGIRLQPDH